MSKEWIRKRKKDPYYKRAKQEGYRSRSAYKLKDMNRRARFIREGGRVLDVGTAPGGWSQVAVEIVGPSGTVLAVDLVPMDDVAGVRFIRGDIEDPGVVEKVHEVCPIFDAVISDATPRLSGNKTLDRGRIYSLCHSVLTLATKVLRKGGSALVKMLQGDERDELKGEFGNLFWEVDTMKPGSSVSSSSEVYLLFRGYRGKQAPDNDRGPVRDMDSILN